MAKADVKAGEAESKKCASCHTFDKGGKNGVGPNQWGLVGNIWAHKEITAIPQADRLAARIRKNGIRRRCPIS